jgi:hypothetical protein
VVSTDGWIAHPLAVLDTVPWLEPLAAMLTTGDWGVAVLSRRGAPLHPVDAVEHIVALAARRSVEVVLVRHERDALGEHGQLAALLRW